MLGIDEWGVGVVGRGFGSICRFVAQRIELISIGSLNEETIKNEDPISDIRSLSGNCRSH